MSSNPHHDLYHNHGRLLMTPDEERSVERLKPATQVDGAVDLVNMEAEITRDITYIYCLVILHKIHNN